MIPVSKTSTSISGLFRVDHGDDVPALDRVAGFDQPLEDGADLHVGTESGHAEFSHDHPS